MAQFGRTWWGERFLAALERFTDAGRLGRGRSYANSGRILEYTVADGEVRAKVRGSINPYFGVYKEPIYDTTIKIAQVPPKSWSRLIERIASRADLIAKLLQQEMPDPIEEVFDNEELHLLPHDRKDFATTCSCPDVSNPCKHIAGVYYRLAADLDRDPLLLFVLRGLSRDALHAELVKSPLGSILASELADDEHSVEPVESFHTRPTKASEDVAASYREFWTGAGKPPPLAATTQARLPALLVKKQGDYPPFWDKDVSFIGVMEEIYERVRTKSGQLK
ncbi:MAG: SWIM zinc finger family protein [Chloroflexi bacterium]|nr:SWIM zinc finger family protein [Chloroflexota bacterium]